MLNKQEHENYMKQILKEIYTSEIKEYLAFKWWTLVYFQYWLDRFSTDIDLDLLDISQKAMVIDKIREILIMLWEIKNETVGDTHRWIFRYDTGVTMNIKVELNSRVWENNTYEILDIQNLYIKSMTKDSIFANKLVALSERFANRDLYDINFFFNRKFSINHNIIRERTGLWIEEFLWNLIVEIRENYKTNSILHGLGEVLDEKQKFWVKKNLLEDTIKQLNTYLSQLK